MFELVYTDSNTIVTLFAYFLIGREDVTYTILQAVELREINNEAALFLENGDLAIINETGFSALKSIMKGKDFDAAAEEIARQFAIPKEVAKSDLHSFLDQLLDLGVLRNETN